jgi:hypothetical protein
MTAKSLALRELEHSVPVLADLPVATILRIRREERDSFEAYRAAIGKISATIMSAKNRVESSLGQRHRQEEIAGNAHTDCHLLF